MSTQFTNRQWRLPNNENKDKQSNYSMDFSSQYIDTTDKFDFIHNTKIFSISVWVKMDSYSDNTLGLILGNNYTGSNSQSGFMFWTDNRQNASDRTEALNFNLWDGTNTSMLKLENVVNDNNWHNYIVVGDGTTLKYYKDGTQLSYTASLSASTSTTAFANLRLGANTYSPPSIYLNGKLDGVAIYNYALSSSQVTTLYGSSSTGIGNPMSLSPKPVAYYPLGDQDAFIGSNYLVPNSSLKDYVFSFDGADDAIDITNNSVFNLGTSFTISGWFNVASYANNNAGYISFDSSSPRGWFLFHQNFTNLALSDGTASYTLKTSFAPTNEWNSYIITYDGTDLIFYLNGQQNSTQTVSINLQTNGNDGQIGNQQFASGRFYNGSISNVQIFNSALPATGSNSVETLYNNGSPLTSMSGYSSLVGWWKLDASATYDSSTTTWTIPDDSSNSNDGTSSGMTQSALQQSDLSFKTSISPFALNFDGTNDYIDLGNLTGVETNQFSISMWAKVTATNRILFNSGLAHPNGIMIQYVGTYFFISVGGSGAASTTITLNTTKWYNILLSVNGTTLKLYIDGSQLGSDLTIGSGRTGIGSDAVLARYKYSTSHYVKGSISNASIWNTALTSSQVTELYNEGVPSNLNNHSAYSNLVNWWQLGSNSSFNTNWTVLDEKGGNNGTSVNMTEDDIVDGVGSYANGLSSGMGGDEVIGDAPYSSSNSLSVNMDVLDRVTDTPS